MESVNAARGIV